MHSPSRLTVLAIGVSKYHHLPTLQGPKSDVNKLYDLLSICESTATCSSESFIQLIDPTSEKVRNTLTEYALSRSAPNDILFLYFSGHGTSLNEDDFGLCTVDTRSIEHGDEIVPIPLNLVRFGDIIETLTAVKVDPVIVIDACYSGIAGELIGEKLERRTKKAGASYILLCACTKYETAKGTSSGGFFSTLLNKVSRQGIGKLPLKRKAILSLNDFFDIIKDEAERNLEFTPRFFQGGPALDFSFVRNVKFRPNYLSIKVFIKTLKLFWNEGNHVALLAADLQKIGSTEHTTYSKLSYKPAWGLLDKAGRGKESRLSDIGVKFMKNEKQSI